jgi:hypothetical protein
MKAVLNVGGGPPGISLPRHYEGWRHVRLDIDPSVRPDIQLDARQLSRLPAATYDAVYCSHNLEHFHRHDAPKVIAGFHHVLKPDGFVEVIVPDLAALFQKITQNNLDLEDELYPSPLGPVLVRDVIFGHHAEIERSGNDFYLHKTGYTPKSLKALFAANGFPHGVVSTSDPVILMGLFFLKPPPAAAQSAPDLI